jgi:short-subunit dehydrogenase
MIIKDKVFVVTGGGSGMGRELVLQLVAKGAKVAVVDINEETMNETIKLAGCNEQCISAHKVNVADKQAVDSLPEAVLLKHGTVDGLINNAGIIQPFVKFNDLQFTDIERVLNINLYGVLYMTRAFLPYLLDRPVASITNISSMGGFLPVPGQTIYGASKAAVKLFTEGLNSELMDTNVSVTVVFPGAIGTNIAANSGVSIGNMDNAKAAKHKVLAAEQAAAIIIDAIEKNKFHVLVGSDAKFMDVIYRLNPKRAAGFIYKQMRDLLG